MVVVTEEDEVVVVVAAAGSRVYSTVTGPVGGSGS
mgnify:CR=1 FL=1